MLERRKIFQQLSGFEESGSRYSPDLVEGVSTVSSVDYGNVGNVAN